MDEKKAMNYLGALKKTVYGQKLLLEDKSANQCFIHKTVNFLAIFFLILRPKSMML